MAIPDIMRGKLRIPVVAAPLFIISNPDLVIAQCKAGIIGSFPSLNARPIEVLDEWLQRITNELAAYDQANPDNPSAPFAVNQIVHRSNDRLDQDMDLCEKYQVPIVITSLGARVESITRVNAPSRIFIVISSFRLYYQIRSNDRWNNKAVITSRG